MSMKKEKFPYTEYQYRLEYKEGKEKKICFFACSEHLMKHVNRYGLTEFVAEHPFEGEIVFEQPKRRGRKPSTKTKKQKVGFSSLEEFFK